MEGRLHGDAFRARQKIDRKPSMTDLIARLQSAPGNDRDLFTEALDLCAPDHDHEWRRRVLLLIRDGVFLDAAMMFAVQGWGMGSGQPKLGLIPEFFVVCGNLTTSEDIESKANTEANARLAVWLKVRGVEA